MRRRTFFCACGLALSGLAGCTSSTADEDTPSTQHTTAQPATTTQHSTTTPHSGPVALLALQPGLTTIKTDAAAYSGGDASQYLYLDLEFTDSEPPAHESLRFHFDGTAHEPIARTSMISNSYGAQYTKRRATGWVLFELPETGDASDARLTWPDGEFHTSESIRTRLERPSPPFAVDVSIQETITAGSTPTVTITATNEGATPGRFMGALSREGPQVASIPVGEITALVPAGETKRIDATESTEAFSVTTEKQDDGEPDLTYTFEWANGRVDHPVNIERAD